MSPEAVVRKFMEEVRSARNPALVHELFASEVLAHQQTSEGTCTLGRTPEDYEAHVREFIEAFGDFSLCIDEFLSSGDKVYVRWRQLGKHVGEIMGFAPTGRPLIDLASAVYRVSEGRIVEYWIQVDRSGLLQQLQLHSRDIYGMHDSTSAEE